LNYCFLKIHKKPWKINNCYKQSEQVGTPLLIKPSPRRKTIKQKIETKTNKSAWTIIRNPGTRRRCEQQNNNYFLKMCYLYKLI